MLVAAAAYADVSSDVGRSVRAGLARTLALAVATIAIGIMATIGFLFIVVPGVIVIVSFAVATPAIMIEGVGPFGGLGRAWRLVSGERWRVFGAGLLMIIITAVGLGIVGVGLHLVFSGVVNLSEGVSAYFSQQIASLLGIPWGLRSVRCYTSICEFGRKDSKPASWLPGCPPESRQHRVGAGPWVATGSGPRVSAVAGPGLAQATVDSLATG